MASIIYLGACFGEQSKISGILEYLIINPPIHDGLQVAIAKGNRIEGIEAKE